MKIFSSQKLTITELPKAQDNDAKLPVSFYVTNLADWVSGVFIVSSNVFYDVYGDEYYQLNEVSSVVILP